MSSVNQSVANYINHLRQQFERGAISENTLLAYMNDIRQFAEFVGNRPVTPDIVSEYVQYLNDGHYAESSVARKIASLRKMLIDLRNNGEYTGALPPATRSARSHREGHLAESYLSPQAIAQILHAVRGDHVMARRERAVYAALYGGALRVSELAMLRRRHYDPQQRLLTHPVTAENVTIEPDYAQALDDFLSLSPSSEADDYIFVTRSGQPIRRQTIWMRLARLTQHLFQRAYSPQALRSSRIMYWLQQGMRDEDIARYLGLWSSTIYRFRRALRYVS